MLFAVIFTDKVGLGAVRTANLQSHIECLEENRSVIPIGGSLRHAPSEIPIGGLWIAEAESKPQPEDLFKTDPVYTAGLRASWQILHWSKANDLRKVLI